jgi:transglutaminase-like putative cysteine protease
MRLHIFHRTRYEYESSARESFNEARLRPTTDANQSCLSHSLVVMPQASVHKCQDLHNNEVQYFEVPEPHCELVVDSISEVLTHTLPVPSDEPAQFPHELLPTAVRDSNCYEMLEPSEYVSTEPEFWRLAIDVCEGETDVWLCAKKLMRHIYEKFVYDQNATDVYTKMSEAVSKRRGVCQDFAHVLIGLCRCLKIPARYVSGYIYSNTTEDKLLGSQATHAWVEVLLPGTGWVGLDPTNNQAVNDHYVKVAVGRDYADVPPLKGTYLGPPSRKLEVAVCVTKLPQDSGQQAA